MAFASSTLIGFGPLRTVLPSRAAYHPAAYWPYQLPANIFVQCCDTCQLPVRNMKSHMPLAWTPSI